MSVVIDVRAEVHAELDEAELIGDRLDRRIETAVMSALAKHSEALAPLSEVLNITSKAAHARMVRDPELRRVGLQVGSRTLFKRSDVIAYFKAKAGAR